MDITSYLLGKNAGGGSSAPTPKTLGELNDIIHNFENELYKVLDSYEAYSNKPLTVYTPNSECNHFMIQKTSTDKYKITWSEYGYYAAFVNSGQQGFCNINLYNGTSTTGNYKSFSTYNITMSVRQSTGSYDKDTAFTSNLFDTLDELVLALQDSAGSEITYTQNAGTTFIYNGVINDSWTAPITNMALFTNSPREITTNGRVLSHNLTVLPLETNEGEI